MIATFTYYVSTKHIRPLALVLWARIYRPQHHLPLLMARLLPSAKLVFPPRIPLHNVYPIGIRLTFFGHLKV